jgi:hypothetical protein
MRYFSIFKPDPGAVGKIPSPEQQAAVGKLIEEMTRSGVLLATEGFMPDAKDVRVRLSGGEFLVTDGPFTEATEVIGGFALMEARSREEVIEHSKRFLRAIGGGVCEIHQLGTSPPLPLERALNRPA